MGEGIAAAPRDKRNAIFMAEPDSCDHLFATGGNDDGQGFLSENSQAIGLIRRTPCFVFVQTIGREQSTQTAEK